MGDVVEIKKVRDARIEAELDAACEREDLAMVALINAWCNRKCVYSDEQVSIACDHFVACANTFCAVHRDLEALRT